jgi:protein gp37
MFTEQRRYGKDPSIVQRTKTWGDPIKWQKQAAALGVSYRVFTCSWSDWFIDQADAWREEAWDIVRRCPNLTFQILTKRADRIAGHLPNNWGNGYPNVWLGVSVEDQQRANERIPRLLQVQAEVRFLSCEPLLGPVDLEMYMPRYDYRPTYEFQRIYHGWDSDKPILLERGIDWVIVGGESGPNARPMHPEWARSIRDQCQAAGVPFLFKQWGEWEPIAWPIDEDGKLVDIIHTVVGDYGNKKVKAEMFAGKWMAKVGKKTAGRLLDGREWNEFPEAAPPPEKADIGTAARETYLQWRDETP